MTIAKTFTAFIASAALTALPVVAQAQDRQPAPITDSEGLGGDNENGVALLAMLALVVLGAILIIVREDDEDDIVNMPSFPEPVSP